MIKLIRKYREWRQRRLIMGITMEALRIDHVIHLSEISPSDDLSRTWFTCNGLSSREAAEEKLEQLLKKLDEHRNQHGIVLPPFKRLKEMMTDE